MKLAVILLILLTSRLAIFGAGDVPFRVLFENKSSPSELSLDQVETLGLIVSKKHPFFSMIQSLTDSNLEEELASGNVILYSVDYTIFQVRDDIMRDEVSVFVDPHVKNINPFGGYWLTAVVIAKTDKTILYYIRGLPAAEPSKYTGEDDMN